MLEAKAGGDAKKARKIVKKKPPEKGYAHWDVNTFNRLITAPPEPLVSRFQVTHGMLLNILGRPTDGCRAMKELVRDSHESPAAKRQLARKAFQLFRSLVDRGIVEIIPRSQRDGRKVRVQVDLQEDFSLNHALSLYLLDTIKLLDKSSPDYALDLLTLVESILENPDLILRRQLDRLKGQKLYEMKAAGMEYEERMEELEKLEYPKPNRDFIYETFNRFASSHPWVGQENIRPKKIARDLYEQFMTFEEYIRDLELQRVEGLLLRYLSETYKVLVQTVPESERTDEIMGMIEYFGGMIRGIDASLLEEWERMRKPGTSSKAEDQKSGADESPEAPDITRNKRQFTVLVRNSVFRLLRLIGSRDYEAAIAALDVTARDELGEFRQWSASDLEAAIMPFYEGHAYIATDQQARDPRHLLVKVEGDQWLLEQIITDPDQHNDWAIKLIVDLAKSRSNSRVALGLVAIQPI
jgi:hypothetical protein